MPRTLFGDRISSYIDFEGTLASDRRVHPKAKDKINLLSKRTKIYILTKEEKEQVEEILKKVKAEIIYLMEGKSSQQKLDLLRQLGASQDGCHRKWRWTTPP